MTDNDDAFERYDCMTIRDMVPTAMAAPSTAPCALQRSSPARTQSRVSLSRC